jgi:hypothetical protein
MNIVSIPYAYRIRYIGYWKFLYAAEILFDAAKTLKI